MRERRSLARESRLGSDGRRNRNRRRRMDAFKRQLVYSVLTPVFMSSLSMFHSLPNSKILLDEILGLRRSRDFEFILLV